MKFVIRVVFLVIVLLLVIECKSLKFDLFFSYCFDFCIGVWCVCMMLCDYYIYCMECIFSVIECCEKCLFRVIR